MREDQVADGLAALGNRTRMRLFRLLVRAGEDGLNVGTLKRRLEIPASTLTHPDPRRAGDPGAAGARSDLQRGLRCDRRPGRLPDRGMLHRRAGRGRIERRVIFFVRTYLYF